MEVFLQTALAAFFLPVRIDGGIKNSMLFVRLAGPVHSGCALTFSNVISKSLSFLMGLLQKSVASGCLPQKERSILQNILSRRYTGAVFHVADWQSQGEAYRGSE